MDNATSMPHEGSNINWKEISVTAGILFAVVLGALLIHEEIKKAKEKKDEKGEGKKP